jgi:hypothetical protein
MRTMRKMKTMKTNTRMRMTTETLVRRMTRTRTKMKEVKRMKRMKKSTSTKTTKTKTTRPKLMAWTSGVRLAAHGRGGTTTESQARNSLHRALLPHQREIAGGRNRDRIYLEAQTRARTRAQASETHLHRPCLPHLMANREAGHLPKRRLASLEDRGVRLRTHTAEDILRAPKKVIAHRHERRVIPLERREQAPRREPR